MIKTIVPGALPMASDINQIANAFQNKADLGALVLASQITAPSAPTLAAGSAGSLNGTYKYQLVLITGWIDDYGNLYGAAFAPSSESTITVTNTQVNVTIPSFSAPVIACAVYRTAAGGASGTEKYVGYVTYPSGTTFPDNLADASLGTGIPTSTSSPAYNGNAIPASVPTGNGTGTPIVWNGGGNNSGRTLYLIPPNSKSVGMDQYGNLIVSQPSQITTGNSWSVADKNGAAVLTVYLDGGTTSPTVVSNKGYGGLGRISGASWSGTIASGGSQVVTHSLGYSGPLWCAFCNGSSQLQLMVVATSTSQSTVYCYSSGANSFSGTIYFF